MPRQIGVWGFRYPNESLEAFRQDPASNVPARSYLDRDIDSGNESVARQMILIRRALSSLHLDRVRSSHNQHASGGLMQVFRGRPPDKERVGARWQRREDKVPLSIRYSLLFRVLFQGYVDRRNALRFLAAVND